MCESASPSQTNWAIQSCVLGCQQWYNSQIFKEVLENCLFFKVCKTKVMKDTSLSLLIQGADVTNYEQGWANTECGIPNDRGVQAEFIVVTWLLLDLCHEGGSEA